MESRLFTDFKIEHYTDIDDIEYTVCRSCKEMVMWTGSFCPSCGRNLHTGARAYQEETAQRLFEEGFRGVSNKYLTLSIYVDRVEIDRIETVPYPIYQKLKRLWYQDWLDKREPKEVN